MPWVVYILLCDQKTFYVGMTSNLLQRLNEHKCGYSMYTKKFSEIQFVYQEGFVRRKDAESRELQLKKWSVAKKKALISGNRDLLIKLSKSSGLGDGWRK